MAESGETFSFLCIFTSRINTSSQPLSCTYDDKKKHNKNLIYLIKEKNRIQKHEFKKTEIRFIHFISNLLTLLV